MGEPRRQLGGTILLEGPRAGEGEKERCGKEDVRAVVKAEIGREEKSRGPPCVDWSGGEEIREVRRALA